MQGLQKIQNLKGRIAIPLSPSAELIPHNQFHKGSWLLPVKNPNWYYFLRKENKNEIDNRSFIQSVDAPLKEMVEFLQVRRIKTTPSCSGHFRSREEYKAVYEALENDRRYIISGGLDLKDIETEEIYTYRNKNYRLPWDKYEFLNQVMQYQHKGILGIRMPEGKLKQRMLNTHCEGIRISEQDGIVFLEVNEINQRDNEWSWKQITECVKRMFIESEWRV